jgi:hypothetical protein
MEYDVFYLMMLRLPLFTMPAGKEGQGGEKKWALRRRPEGRKGQSFYEHRCPDGGPRVPESYCEYQNLSAYGALTSSPPTGLAGKAGIKVCATCMGPLHLTQEVHVYMYESEVGN